MNLQIRLANHQDADSIWEIAHEVVKKGDTWVLAPDTSKTEMLAYWLDAKKHTYVAEIEGKIVGMFFND